MNKNIEHDLNNQAGAWRETTAELKSDASVFPGDAVREELKPLSKVCRFQNGDYSQSSEIDNTPKNRERDQDYWLKRFSGEFVRNNFQYDYKYKEIVPNGRILDRVEFRFPGEIFSKLMSFSNETDTNLFKVLTAGLVVILARNTFTQSSLKDITVGTPVLFNQRKGIETKSNNTVLALRNQFEENIAFKDLVTKVSKTIDEAQQHKDFPLEELPEKLKMQAFSDDFPLFDVGISLENIQDKQHIHHLNVNMIFSFFRTDKYIDGVVEFNSSLYERTTVEKIISHFTNLLRSALADANKDRRISGLDILSPEERTQLLYEFNDEKMEYPKDKPLHEFFEEKVEQTPDNEALVFQDQQISYRAFNESTNQLTRILREKVIKPEYVAGLMVDRSIEMLVGIMAVLKAGGAYLPINPSYPRDRILYLLKDSNSKLLLTQEKYFETVEFDGEEINLESESLYQGNKQNLEIVNFPTDLVYVIYTSGSTGQPKGVMIQHGSAVNTLMALYDKYPLEESDTYLLKTSFMFDVSVSEIFGWFWGGGRLSIMDPDGEKDPLMMIDKIEKEKITHVNFVPSMFNLFVNILDIQNISKLSRLKYIFLAGEAIWADSIVKFRGLKSNVVTENIYGPTEATIYASRYPVDKWKGVGSIPIGIPMNNTKLYILSSNDNVHPGLKPGGIPGELAISGIGLAKGYLNRPELTREKFIDNPFAIEEGWNGTDRKLYRTGDLALWMPDGNIEYLGRIDHQVKVRGFRIETGEIENHILKQPNIKEAVVIAQVDASGEKYLCAYLVADEKIDILLLNSTLLELLPDYMVPSYFMQLEKIPLNPSGKVNRKLLPDPTIKRKGEDYVAPRNEIEKKLVEIWSELLYLRKDIIGIDDSFFKLGGHSLKAAVMITAIHKELQVKVLMHQIFDMPTIRKLGEYIKGAKVEKYLSIDFAEKKEYYTQTSAQKRLYFIDQLENVNILYNLPMIDIYCKGIKKQKLERAFQRLIKRHESLRTSFFAVDGEAVQKIHDYETAISNFELQYYEATEEGLIYKNTPAPRETKSLIAFTGVPFDCFPELVEFFIRPFDLGQSPLLRVGLIKILGNTKILMMDMHHIISDGISMIILLKELWQLYDEEQLPPLYLRYKDYAEWLNHETQKQEIKKQESFWCSEFSGEIPVLNLPFDYPVPTQSSFDGNTLYFEIEKEQVQQLKKAAREQETNLYVLLLSLYNVLMAKLSGQEDIIVGTVTAGRNHTDLHDIIGMFVKTLALRNYPFEEKSFAEFLKEVKEKNIRTLENQDYPFEQLVSQVNVDSNQARTRHLLFNVVFVLQNETERTDRYLLEVLMLDKSNPYLLKIKKSKFDMTLMGVETGDSLQFILEYNVQLFKEKTIERFINCYKKIVSSICSDINRKISQIEIISEEDKAKVLYIFNDTEAEYPKDKTIHELFQDQVARIPDNTAVEGYSLGTGADLSLRYKELNAKANQLARILRARGIKPDHIAAVMVEPSVEMIIGMLAVLKAGAGFLPIDHKIPKERVKYMLDESVSKLFLTRLELGKEMDYDGEIIQMDDAGIYSGDECNLEPVNKPDDLAYVIYTSGSTGKPKGVLGEHLPLINLCYWYNRYFGITPGDRATKYASFGFDASVWEIFPHLLKGSSLYIVPEEIKLDIIALNRYFEDNGITVSFLPTQMGEQFMSIDNRSLRVLQAAGDKLKSFVKNHYQLYNCYGPTENTVCATAYLVTEFKLNIPIGGPIANNQVYILDKNRNILPIGVPGELCVGGDSVARGYLNNPGLTMEKFVENPHPLPIPLLQSPVLYRTGDLARWLADGNIEFLGRIDYQVKVRGFRIELGEIENQLLHIEDIKEAVVISREDTSGHKYLCAYIVPEKAKDINIESIKNTLAKNLPGYMIPTYLVPLEGIHLNPNGKIDWKALPEPETKGVEYVIPTNETEKVLAEIWEEVLGVEKVGIDDNFFEMGGDSIKTILISSKLLKCQLSTNVNDFFLYPTIRKLSAHIKKLERTIEQGIVTGEVELTPIQQWFFENHLSYCHHFNQSMLLSRKKGFKEEIIKKVFIKILEHHDALRMVYGFEQDTVIQTIRGMEGKLFELEVIQLTKKKKEEIVEEIKTKANRIQQGIDLKTGPLVKLGLFKGDEGDLLLIVIHHLVVDGVSWRILVEDFETGYQQAARDKKIIFQDKTDSFQYWAQNLRFYAGTNKLVKEIAYWKDIEDTAVKSLPVDHEIVDKERMFKYHDIVPMTLTEKKTKQLLTKVNWTYNTEINDILLTAVGLAFKQWCKLDKVLVNLEGHGREKIIEDVNINRTVGWFTTQYPVILDMKRSQDLSFSIMNVKETLRRIPNKGIGHGILKYLTPDEKKESIHFTHTPEIVFNYLGQFGNESYDIIDEMSEISALSTGDSIAPDYINNFKIDIEGATMDGKLNLYFFYHKNEYERKTIEKLAGAVKSNLEQVIDHCVSKEKRELTPSDLEYSNLTIEELERITNYIRDNIAEDMEIQLIYPLSPMQSGMLYHSLKNKESDAYFEQIIFPLHGEIEPSLLEKSLHKVIERHDILRTIFAYELLEEPLQIVLKDRHLELYYEDITHLNEHDRAKYIEKYRLKDKEKRLCLTRGPLIRFALFKTDANTHLLMWTFHHILMDGWCFGITSGEMRKIYRSLRTGEPLELEPTLPYVNYINWLEKQDREEGLGFWKKYLEDYGELTSIPKPWQQIKSDEYKKQEYHFVMDEGLTAGMEKIAGEYQVTLNTVFQVIWGILLQQYNNSNDVVFGNIVSGRPWEIQGIEQMVGLFINMVPVRIKRYREQKFSQLLGTVQEESLSSKKHDYLPVAEIQSHSVVKGDLIDHLVVFENYPVQEEIEETFTIGEIMAFEQSNYNFNIIVLPGNYLEVNFSYNMLVYDSKLMMNIARQLEKVIRQVVDDPAVDIGEIEILSGEEKNKILYEFNNTRSEYPKNKTINELFEDIVDKYPDNKAVIGMAHGPWGPQLTYKELNAKVNQLARLLRSKVRKPGEIAAIMVEPSQEMLIAMLGILKAGSAFLPIDHKIPKDRVKYMLDDSISQLFLTRLELVKEMDYDGEIIQMDDAGIYSGDKNNLEPLNRPDDPAYVIYTSGSTGRPKGVLGEHLPLINLCYWYNRYFGITPGDRSTKYASFGFDASVWEIFPHLLKGSSLYIVPEEIKLDINALNRYFEDNGITVSFLPTQMGEQFMSIKNRSLRVLQAAGDKLKSFVKSHFQLYNCYGPTENTVCATAYLVTEFNVNIPIGEPIANNQVYILDRNNNLQPIEVPGELCIGGESLARGYLNRPLLTSEKFMELKGKKWLPAYIKIYRTGDLARWLSDGNIEFLGRIDFQVKIRGFRIEPGEIDNHLIRIDFIKEAAVIARKDASGSPYLCAYFVAPRKVDITELKGLLMQDLPPYMIPSYFVQMEALPLTSSGKVDRRALPEPEIEAGEDYEAPETENEKLLAEIWQEVLGVKKVSVVDNFFEIGGDSIKTILISARLQKHGLSTHINEFFNFPTIRQVARHLKKAEDELEKEVTARDEEQIAQDIKKDLERYRQQVNLEKWPDLSVVSDLKNILVTGSTGYLGSYLVYQLMRNSKAVLYLPVRAATQEKAEERIQDKLGFYFGKNFFNKAKGRLVVVKADLTTDRLGIGHQLYNTLSGKVEAVVHSAANVKHFGAYREFHRDNVEVTERLLEFALNKKKKAFHFISTMDTGSGDIAGKDYLVFTEYCHDEGQRADNVYIKSKFAAEKRVLAYREKGLNTSIYRAGNLTFHSQTGQFQENIEDNFFYSMLRALIKMGFWSDNMKQLEFELSFVNLAAEAIVRILTREQLRDNTYHIYNPHILSWNDMAGLLKEIGVELPEVETTEFQDFKTKFAGNPDYEKIIERVNLYSSIWEDKTGTQTVHGVDRTVKLLKEMGFEWPKVNKEHIEKMINHCKKVGFI